MNHTRYENKNTFEDSGEIMKWLHENINSITTVPCKVSMNRDGTISEIEIGKKLTIAERKKITDKFPELVGKEIG
tara:strand:+ start:2017 stop:2241 length:225 start_codon:yes stop_codon:yes gene_type:complete